LDIQVLNFNEVSKDTVQKLLAMAKEDLEYNNFKDSYLINKQIEEMDTAFTFFLKDSDTGKIVGFLAAHLTSNHFFYEESILYISDLDKNLRDSLIISGVYIIPEYRGHRLSSRLLKHLISYCNSLKFKIKSIYSSAILSHTGMINNLLFCNFYFCGRFSRNSIDRESFYFCLSI